MTDSRELATAETRAVSHSSTSIPGDQRLMMLREALTNPDVDPTKAAAMFNLMNQMEDRERQAEFNRDKAAALRAMPVIFKGGKSDKHRYAKFEDMHRAALPVLTRFRLSIDFRLGSEGQLVTVQPILRHENGFIEEGAVMKGPADTGPGRSPIQSLGSASSYLKRYTMKGMLNIIEDGEDNDGAIGRENYHMNDRQEGLIVDAQAAADRGEYAAWFSRLNIKDKAVVIGSGTHARLSGVLALPGASKAEPDRADPPAKTGPDVNTAEGWTEQYELDCAAAPDRDALVRIQTKGAKAMGRLQGEHPDLYARAIAAGSNAVARLMPADDGGE